MAVSFARQLDNSDSRPNVIGRAFASSSLIVGALLAETRADEANSAASASTTQQGQGTSGGANNNANVVSLRLNVPEDQLIKTVRKLILAGKPDEALKLVAKLKPKDIENLPEQAKEKLGELINNAVETLQFQGRSIEALRLIKQLDPALDLPALFDAEEEELKRRMQMSINAPQPGFMN
jgi:hypothetical protein